MKKTYLFLALVMVMISVNSGICAHEADKGKDKKEPVVKSVLKEVEGEISSLTKRSISIVYERDTVKGEEFEILLPFDPADIKLEHKKSLSEIGPGDTVLVQYTEDTSDYGDRLETKIKVVTIRFLKPADARSPYKPKAAAQEQAQDIEGLTLKGVKSDE